MLFPRERHWLFDRLAAELHYHVPVGARLGNGMRIVVPWNDDGGRAIYETGWYEPATVTTVESLLKPGMVFMDIGANMGQYSLLASRIVGDAGAVHSFEPSPTMYPWLMQNVRLNKADNVQTNRLGLSDCEKIVTLYLSNPKNQGATSMRPQYNFSGKTAEVKCLTLDAYLAHRGIGKVDVMKIDVEGAELEVFRGAEKLLTGNHPPSMVIEFEEGCQVRFGSSCAKLAAHLTARGYELMTIRPSGLERYELEHSRAYTLNVLAVPQTRADRLLFPEKRLDKPLEKAPYTRKNL
jgi:FkbM family methyltransferase